MDPSYREAVPAKRRFYIGTNCHVACIDAETGETVWQETIHQSLNSTLVSLLHYKDLLFATCTGTAVCLTVEGKERWRNKISGLGEPAALALDPGVPGGQLLIAAAGKLFALSAEDGKLQWKNELPGLGYYPVCLRAPGLITTTTVSVRQGKVMVQFENVQVG